MNEGFWYEITLTNNGPATATNIEVLENLPTGLLYTGHIETAGIYSVANATWFIPSLAAGESAKLVLDAEGIEPGWAYNTVTILTADQEDTSPNNNEAAADVYIYQPMADLSLIKTMDTTCVTLGDTIAYILTLFNDGPDPASNIVVTDILPSQVTCVGTTDPSYDPYLGDYTWNIGGPLAASGSVMMTIYTIANEVGPIYNEASIVSSDQYDPNLENNFAGVKGEVKAPETDLQIVKTVSTETAEPGEEFTFFIELTNNGPHPATNIEVVENLPVGLDYLEHNESEGVYNISTGIWFIGNLEVGETALLMIETSSLITGYHTNVANIMTADQEDTNPDNNEDDVTILINTNPECGADYVQTTCDLIEIEVLTNDFDADGDSLFICDYTNISHGSIGLVGDVFVYDPPYVPYYGSIDFSYTVCDGLGGECSNVVTIDLDCDPNDPPVCADDVYQSNCTVISLPVLINDTDPDGDELAICEYSLPQHGTISETEIGFIYTPAGDYSGMDGFTYTVCDPEGESCTSTVSIQVTCIICETADIHTCVDPITPLIVCPDWCFNDNIDGSNVEITDMHTTFNCSLVDLDNGCIQYTGLPLFEGMDEVEITGCADGYCETVTAYVNVGGCCEPEPIYACTTPLTPLVVCPDWCLDGEIDIEEMHTTFECSLTDLGNGCLRYMPLPLFEGPDTIQIIGCIGGDCESTVAYVEVGSCGQNEPPIAINDFDESDGTPITIPILLNDSDPDGDPIYVCGFTNPNNGTVQLIDNELFIYTPNNGFDGIDNFTYTICDGNGGEDVATVTITVEPEECIVDQVVCVPPFVNPSVPTVVCIDFCTLGPDIEIQSLTSTSSNCSMSLGTGTCFSILPAPLFLGELTISLTACDANQNCETANVYVTVGDCDGLPTSGNQSPVAVNDTINDASANEYVVINLLSNDYDIDGNTLEICDHTAPAFGTVSFDGGIAHYNASEGFSGTDMFAYAICDEYGATATAMVIVTIDSERLENEAKSEAVYCTPSIPNPITPNGGTVKTLSVIVDEYCVENAHEISLVIHDVNGRTLYEQVSEQVENLTWDAKVNKVVVPTGIYVYELKFHTPEGVQRYTGLVQVAR